MDTNSHRADESTPKKSDKTTASSARPKAEPVVTLIEFSDFNCSDCSQMVPIVDELIRSNPGKVRLVLKDFPLASHAGSELAHEACLAAKAQGKYSEMYHLLLANQQQLAESDLLKYGKQLHLDITKFELALKTRHYEAEVAENKSEGMALGVTATPTFFVNGRKLEGVQTSAILKAQVVEALELGASPGSTKAKSDTETGTAGNFPARGSPDAPIVITEYADFQCPFCASARKTIDQILLEYPHKVKLVFKSFPLDFHPDSMLAHRAAMAAGEQGKFWEMHDLIFSHQRAMKHDDLLAMAKSLDLDMDRFQADLQNEKLQRQIYAEREEGKHRGVNGTPTFFVDGQQLLGASATQFEGLITKALVAKGMQTDKAPLEAEAGPTRGAEHAPVTVLWYSDVSSPLAVGADHLMQQLLDAYPGQILIVFKNRPLEFHPDAVLAHEALVAAAAQGQFWPMHRTLLVHQHALSATDLTHYAADLGLDTDKFLTDITSQYVRDQVQRDLSQAREAGVNGVPVFFVNGTRLDGVQPFSSLKTLVDAQIQKTHVAVVHE